MYSEEDYTYQEQAPQPLTFGQQITRVSKIGLFFAGSMTWALLSRTFPEHLMPIFKMTLAGGMIAATLTLMLDKSPDRKGYVIVFGGLILGGIIGGTWDAVSAWFADISGQTQGLQGIAVIAAVALAVLIEIWMRGQKDD